MTHSFSIVTPSLDQAEFLEEAIESVSSQASCAAQHVVQDGGSTDGTLDILRRHSNVEWVSERDRGQSDAVNLALERATGDYIGWLNADDFYLEDALSRVGDFFVARPDVDVVYGECVFVDAAGRAIRSKAEHRFDERILLYYGCYIPTVSTFYRRSMLERGLLRLDVDAHYVMDYELYLRMTDAGARFAHLPLAVGAFRWHDANKSLDRGRVSQDRLRVQKPYLPPGMPQAWLEPARELYRAKRVMLKLISGGLGRELEARRKRGADMRWWRSAPGAEAGARSEGAKR